MARRVAWHLTISRTNVADMLSLALSNIVVGVYKHIYSTILHIYFIYTSYIYVCFLPFSHFGKSTGWLVSHIVDIYNLIKCDCNVNVWHTPHTILHSHHSSHQRELHAVAWQHVKPPAKWNVVCQLWNITTCAPIIYLQRCALNLCGQVKLKFKLFFNYEQFIKLLWGRHTKEGDYLDGL